MFGQVQPIFSQYYISTHPESIKKLQNFLMFTGGIKNATLWKNGSEKISTLVGSSFFYRDFCVEPLFRFLTS